MPRHRPENILFDPAEAMPRDELKALQAERLRETVRRVADVPFYKEHFDRLKITPECIQSPDDVKRLPFTTKADLRTHYPLGFLAVPRENVCRFQGSSGTTGNPTMVAYTANDKHMWAGCCARFLTAGGLRPEHTAQIAFGFGLFTGGFGLHFGIERVGAAILPAAAGNTERQLLLLRDLGADALVCTPSYALVIGEALRAANFPRESFALKFGFFGGEPWTDEIRARLEDLLGIFATDNYGLSEVIGPGVSGECVERNGMHFWEDHFLVECLDPKTLEPVPEGEPGELVLTSLTKEAMPIIRYRTRDIATLNGTPCPCGRTGIRMSRVTGRSDDMMIIRGVNVYPTQIEEALLRVEGTAPHYQIELDRPGAMDVATLRVEVDERIFSDSMKDMQVLKGNIDRAVTTVTGIHFNVELVAPQTLERFTGKAKRVLDKRGILKT